MVLVKLIVLFYEHILFRCKYFVEVNGQSLVWVCHRFKFRYVVIYIRNSRYKILIRERRRNRGKILLSILASIILHIQYTRKSIFLVMSLIVHSCLLPTHPLPTRSYTAQPYLLIHLASLVITANFASESIIIPVTLVSFKFVNCELMINIDSSFFLLGWSYLYFHGRRFSC